MCQIQTDSFTGKERKTILQKPIEKVVHIMILDQGRYNKLFSFVLATVEIKSCSPSSLGLDLML